jgi:hypothetical protein
MLKCLQYKYKATYMEAFHRPMTNMTKNLSASGGRLRAFGFEERTIDCITYTLSEMLLAEWLKINVAKER